MINIAGDYGNSLHNKQFQWSRYVPGIVLDTEDKISESQPALTSKGGQCSRDCGGSRREKQSPILVVKRQVRGFQALMALPFHTHVLWQGQWVLAGTDNESASAVDTCRGKGGRWLRAWQEKHVFVLCLADSRRPWAFGMSLLEANSHGREDSHYGKVSGRPSASLSLLPCWWHIHQKWGWTGTGKGKGIILSSLLTLQGPWEMPCGDHSHWPKKDGASLLKSCLECPRPSLHSASSLATTANPMEPVINWDCINTKPFKCFLNASPRKAGILICWHAAISQAPRRVSGTQ